METDRYVFKICHVDCGKVLYEEPGGAQRYIYLTELELVPYLVTETKVSTKGGALVDVETIHPHISTIRSNVHVDAAEAELAGNVVEKRFEADQKAMGELVMKTLWDLRSGVLT